MQLNMQTGPMMLPTPIKLFERLQPLENMINRRGFVEFSGRLRRPYFRLSEEDCAKVETLAGKSDVLLFDGKTQVTWGDADGGKALMPLYRPL